MNSRLLVSLLLCCTLVGCEALKELAANFDKPTAAIEGVNFDDLTLQDLALSFDVKVSNPYPADMPIDSLGYSLASGATSFLTGQTGQGTSIPANSSKVIKVPVTVNFMETLKALSGVKPGALVPYKASLDVAVDAPGFGPMTLPLEQEGEFPIPTPPTIELAGVQWTDLSLQNAAANLDLKIGNGNDFPFSLSNLGYDLSLGGKEIVKASVASGSKFAAGGEGALSIPISFSPASFGLAAFNMLTGEGSGYRLAGTMDLDTPFGPLSYPYDSTGQTVFTK